MQDFSLNLAGDRLVLMPERTAYWPAARTLIAADLHWGKSEVLQSAGITLPSAPLNLDLERLASAVRRMGAERLLILGDLIHAPSGVTAQVEEAVAVWRQALGELRLELIRGNHDRRWPLPSAWRIVEQPDGFAEAPWRFMHAAPSDNRDEFSGVILSGHMHPAVVLRGRGDQLRLPCFYLHSGGLVLPAFGALTGHFSIKLGQGEKAYAVTPTSVLQV